MWSSPNEDEVDDCQHRFESLRSISCRRDHIRNPRIPNLRLAAHNPLSHRRRSLQKRTGNLFGRQPANLAQRKGLCSFYFRDWCVVVSSV